MRSREARAFTRRHTLCLQVVLDWDVEEAPQPLSFDRANDEGPGIRSPFVSRKYAKGVYFAAGLSNAG